MNIWTLTVLLSIVIASTSAGSQPQECPEKWFDATFVSIIDQVVPAAELTANSPFTFFKDIMKFTDEEIEEATQDAIMFFDTKFGLDFSSEPDEMGRRFYENATFFPYQPLPVVSYTVTFNRWIVNGNTRTLCFPNNEGGFQVIFNQPQLLRGTYGGTEGRLVNPGGDLFWGFYNIPVCPQSPIVIQLMSGTPLRFEPIDGFAIINNDLFHRSLGNGTAQGIFRATPLPEEPDMLHFNTRIIFTFPKRSLIP